MIWLLLRSGVKPRRLTYPCQRVAAANSVGFLAYLAALLGSATLLRRLKETFTPGRLAFLVIGLLLTATLQGSVTTQAVPALAQSLDLPGWTSFTAVSDVFVVTDIPEPVYSLDGGDIPSGVAPDEALHDDGVDSLIDLMEAYGDYFYATTIHPDGLLGSNDVIVVKVNNQWDGRNGTNTDTVKGVIYRLVNHPDGFTGAVIIAENTQGYNADWYHQTSSNNSQFQDQSYWEVTQAFVSEGYRVCIADWRSLRTNLVADYDVGDNTSGYVLEDADSSPEEQGHGRLSYPKFQINCSGMDLSISMKQGIWNGSSFDNNRLKMINMPVLKRHNSAWATISVKNYLGFITTCSGAECSISVPRWVNPNDKHCWMLGPSDNGTVCAGADYAPGYGLIARQMARIRRADLNIVDAIWVNPRDNAGWHGEAQRLDVLLSSRDPFAVDYYASDYLLGPLIRQQYGAASGYEQAMASTHGGWFRNTQMRNVARLRDGEGITDTITMTDTLSFDQERLQFNVYATDANASWLRLQAPNGGQVWTAGTQEQIRWASTGDVGNVRLEYTTDGFTSSHTITGSTANTGAYTWTIPADPSDSVLVRVRSAISTTISDTNDVAFRIVLPPLPPTLTLQAPNGGQIWTAGTQEQIRWASTGDVGNVRLEYTTDGFTSSHTITVSTLNTGAYTWTIPADPSDSVLVRISTLTATISDTSDVAFSIVSPLPPPTLTLQAPNGGQVWTAGTQEQIRWASTGDVGNVRLEYTTDGFTSSHTITGSTANTGAYTWTIPADLSDSVLVRVSSALTTTISDTSDVAFTISGPYRFEESFMTTSHRDLKGGERITYTIVLYEGTSATLMLTDTIPSSCTYVLGSVSIEPDWKGTVEFPDAAQIHWSGIVTGGVPVTITFQVQVPVIATTLTITNHVLVSRNGVDLVQLNAVSFLDSFRVYLPAAFHNVSERFPTNHYPWYFSNNFPSSYQKQVPYLPQVLKDYW
ncbi:MAG: DUF362 domain-containing protein [Chloroflexi bacterium]|nr:DUF362 domain-containing protein [Chloroflexota bacterium]